MTKDNFDGVIDPEESEGLLAEAMSREIQEETTILELLVKDSTGRPVRVKVRYMPQSIASSLQYDDGTPITPANSRLARKPKFDFKKWAKERIPKMNDLALRNIQIVNDLDGASHAPQKGDILLSKISSGEFFRLESLCFPGASEDAPDSGSEDSVSGRSRGKGLRGGQPSPASE
jgi:hypothetical protein